MNQTAQYLASKGRNGDTMLVHMSPQEVGGLQTLARNNGTSLTVNPQTGLPEAFNLGRLLPMVAGAGLTMLSGGTLSPLTIGLMTGGLGAVATGSLKEGLMMGLGAAGGAGLAGSMANLAAPAVGAAAPAGAAVGAPSAMAGAGSGLTVPAAAVNTAPTGALVNSAAMPQVGTLTAPSNALSLPSISTPASVVTPGMTAVPPPGALANNLTGLDALKQSALTPPAPPASVVNQAATDGLSSPFGLKSQPFQPVGGANGITQAQAQTIYNSPGYNPALSAESQFYMRNPTSLSLTDAAPKTIEAASLNTPKPYGDRLAQGFRSATSSMQSAGDFLSNNKMNLAMSAAPMMMPEEPEAVAERESFIRPYTLEIDNTSDIAASPVGREDQRLRYRYTAGTPYRAAQGGIIAFAEGGNTTDGQEIGSNPLSPEAASVYQSIARVQGLAGLPRIDLSTMPVAQPSPVARLNASQPSQGPMYRQMDYGIPMPNVMNSETYKQLQEDKKNKSSGESYAEGGQARFRDVRKKIDRMADPYGFTGYQRGEGLYESAQRNFAGGGLSNVPRFLSGGGDGMSDSIPATINDRQPARLADGEFVIPADVVSHLGNGSSKAGAKQLYAMMDRVRSQRTGKKKQAPAVNPKKMMPA